MSPVRASTSLPPRSLSTSARPWRTSGASPPKAGEHRTSDGALTLAVREAGALAGARLTAEEGGLRCELTSAGPLDEPALAAIRDRLSCRLGLDDDLAEFYRIAAADLAFRPVVARLHGYPKVKFASPVEMLCWAVLSQRTRMPVARKAKQAIVTTCGNLVVLDGDDLWAFPELDQLLALGPEQLLELVGNERKTRFLHGALHR
ncbi:hypothetical protein [Saccharopolyspora spinosa]|uniref:hypothetical protein n=1 Tax=Saccharopolyspora spinosa TaxID=60894 RepID=UPI000237B69A|nr:hypothetical protein [Saccharopolyspora spinosa]